MVTILPWVRRSKEFYLKAMNHPANKDALAYFESRAIPLLLAKVIPWSELAFAARVHPDLSHLLYEAAKELPNHYSHYLYGFDVLANPQGVVFALADSMSTLAFRLPERLRSEALQSGGIAMPHLGNDWVQFDPWERRVSDQKRVQLFRFWCESAYQYANEL